MAIYEFIVQNHIDPKRLRDFAGITCKRMDDGKTKIYGNLKDQSELFAVLNKIRDMNLELISIMKGHKELEE